MRISDWSSDVCSSDLARLGLRPGRVTGKLDVARLVRMNLPPGVAPDTPGARAPRIARMRERLRGAANDDPHGDAPAYAELHCLSDFSFLRGAASEIGRASCRERVCQSV